MAEIAGVRWKSIIRWVLVLALVGYLFADSLAIEPDDTDADDDPTDTAALKITRVKPVERYTKLTQFCKYNDLKTEQAFCERSIRALQAR